jgi:hypothetical protein
MCVPASFVVTENNVYWSRTSDSHEDIISENGLSGLDSERVEVVRVEITPPDNNWLLPIEQWEASIDQDILPWWYNYGSVVGRCMEKLPCWIKCKIIMPGEIENTLNRKVIAIYGVVGRMMPGSYARSVLENAHILHADGASIYEVGGRSRIGCADDCFIEFVSENAFIESISGSSSISAVRGSAQVKLVSGYTVIWNVVGSSVVEEMTTHTRVCNLAGQATVGMMFDYSVIEMVRDDAVVPFVRDKATILMFDSSSPIKVVSGSATVKSRRCVGETVVKDQALFVFSKDGCVNVTVGDFLYVA